MSDMEDSDSLPKCSFLNIPQEIRDQIIGEIFFPGEKEPESLEQNGLGLAPTAIRQIWPYDRDSHRKPKFDVAIIRTCRQLQHEAEHILYGTSSFNLMYQDWSDNVKLSYEFFQGLTPRLQRLVQRVERKCYSRPYRATISLFDWTAFMTFLARECPSLHSLKLWGPGDRYEGPPWVQTCKKDEPWVKAILQIRSLRYFDIPVIAGGVIYNYPEFKDDFLPWLRNALTNGSRQLRNNAEQSNHETTLRRSDHPIDFLSFPHTVRQIVYKHLLLPSDRRIHIGLGHWYDRSTKHVLPLFLTSKQLYLEASSFFYGAAIFTSALEKYNPSLVKMLRHHYYEHGPPVSDHSNMYKYPPPIKNVRFVQTRWNRHLDIDFIEWLVSQKDVESLEVVINDNRLVLEMNLHWNRLVLQQLADADAEENVAKPEEPSARLGTWRGCWNRSQLASLAKIPKVTIETEESLDVECLQWLTVGLRREYLKGSSDIPDLDWLYADPDELRERPTPSTRPAVRGLPFRRRHPLPAIGPAET